MSVETTMANILVTGGSSVLFAQKPIDNNSCIVYHVLSDIPVRDVNRGTYRFKKHIQLDVYGTTENQINTSASFVINSLENNGSFVNANMVSAFPMKDVESKIYVYKIDYILE